MIRSTIVVVFCLVVASCQSSGLTSQDSDVVYKSTSVDNARLDVTSFLRSGSDHSLMAGQSSTENAETHTIKTAEHTSWVWLGSLSQDRSYDTESRPDHFVKAFYTWPYLSNRNFEFKGVTGDTHQLGKMQYGVGVDDKGACMFFDVHFGSVYYSETRFQNMIQGYRCVESEADVDMKSFIAAAKSLKLKP